MPQIALLVLALLAMWRPAETSVATPVVIAAGVLLLIPWAHRRTTAGGASSAAVALPVVGVGLVLSAAGGWERSTAVIELALMAAVAALAWLASREEPAERTPRLLALGIAALSLWAMWQVAAGFERSAGELASLPDAFQHNAAERIASGRAFASLLLPGHLAVLLATALPILAAGVARSWRTSAWLAGAILCGAGLVLTRSPIGIGLAILALAALAARRRRRVVVIGALVILAVALAVVMLGRADVTELEPVRLRADNWRTALWAWSTSPWTGVGLGSYGQATRMVPFEVGNLPAHAHSLPLEWLAENGVVGMAAFLVIALWLVNLVRRLWPRRPELAVGLAVVPLHNLVDFSLYTSGVALPWAVLLGWGLACARSDGEAGTGEGVGGRRELLVAAAAVAVAMTVLHATSATVEEAARAAGDARERLTGALTAQRLAPWRPTPPLLAAVSALDAPDAGRLEAAALALERGRWWRPRSASVAAAAGEVALARGWVPTAAAGLWTAQRDQPRSNARRDAWDELVQRLEMADGGTR